MATTRIQEKLSKLVSTQLPEFIQSDYATFVAFLEAYYEFLEQDQGAQELLQNARSYNDIDRTINSFIKYFLQQYGSSIPSSVVADKKLLIKNLKDLYNTKGSIKSYKLLFKLLFNKDVSVTYPSQLILRASDGKWVQKTSVFIKNLAGDGNVLLNKNVFITSPTTKFPVVFDSRRTAFNSQGQVSNTFEYFFNNSKNIPISIGDIIEYGSFKGEVVGVPTSIVIQTPGTGFRVGDILPLTSGLGVGARLKVTKVSSTGGILNAQLISFGLGYASDFLNFFSGSLSQATFNTFSYISGTASISETLSGFVERGTITTQTYAASNYFADDYTGDLLREFFTDASVAPVTGSSTVLNETIVTSTGAPSDASILVRIGAKARYPGYYETSDGFLSDAIYLEDANYYQPYSYLIKIDESLSLYKQAVLDLLHPAGTKLFGEYELTNNIDISTEITSVFRILTSFLQSAIGGYSDTVSKHTEKNISSLLNTGFSVTKVVIKNLTSTNLSANTSSASKITVKNLSNVVTAATSSVSYLANVNRTSGTVVLDNIQISGINNIILTTTLSIADSGSAYLPDYTSNPFTINSYFSTDDYAGTFNTF